LLHEFAEMAALGGGRTHNPLRLSTAVLASGHGWRSSLRGGADKGRRIIVNRIMSGKKIMPALTVYWS
jgi:hypothetical protein